MLINILTVILLAGLVYMLLFYISGFLWSRGNHYGYEKGYKKGYMEGGLDSIGIMTGLMVLSKEEREEITEKALNGEDPIKLLKNKLKEKGI